MNEQVNHWIEDEQVRKRFWAFAKNELSLTDEEVHAALGVGSVKDFDSDMHAAKTLLEDFAEHIETYRIKGGLKAQDQAHAEARAIAFTEMYAPSGARINVTAREGATADSVALTALALVDAMTTLEQLGWQTNGRREKREATMPHAVVVEPEPAAQQPPAPPGAPSATGGNGHGDSETFLVESVTAQVSPNGNRYYAIRGGSVKKHGATAWPEVAEPQLKAITDYDVANLNVGQAWEVAGFGIQAVGEIPEGKKYPNKVVSFAPGGGA